MSLCDTCIQPGHCCRDLVLSGGPGGWEPHNYAHLPMSHEAAEHFAIRNGLPFRPLRQQEDGTWRWWCTNLDSDGRCGDYENRPELCKSYPAGSDPLCVHHWADDRYDLVKAEA